jgi:hypothetical protein
MISTNIAAYLRLEWLPESPVDFLPDRSGVAPASRKTPRFDLTAMAGCWPPLDRLKTRAGYLYFYLIPTDKVAARSKGRTTPSYFLQCTPAGSKTVNFSGVRFERAAAAVGKLKEIEGNVILSDPAAPPRFIYASGEPPQAEHLRQGIRNPMYGRRGDAFLFLFSEGMRALEVLIVTDGRALIDEYRRQLANGDLNDVIEALRAQARSVTR